VLVYARPDEPEWMFSPSVTEDGRYLVLHVSHGTDPRNRVFYADLELVDDLRQIVVELLAEFDAAYGLVGNVGSTFYFLTDRDAPRSRLVGIDLHTPGRSAGATSSARPTTPSSASSWSAGAWSPATSSTPGASCGGSPSTASPTARWSCRASARSRAWPGARRTTTCTSRSTSFTQPAVDPPPHRVLRRDGDGPPGGCRHRPGRLRHRAGLRDERGRDAGPGLPRPPGRRRADRGHPDPAVGLRRVPHLRHADVPRRLAGVGRARRPARRAEPARRWRVRAGLARRRPTGEQAERLRRRDRYRRAPRRRRAGPSPSGSRSRAAPTAACSPARA
jgi:hypothetical protein